jgi:DNA segregation ATPase FtsK/SpoIIIE, S-DNA-T family
MAPYSRSRKRQAIFPSGMTDFLKHRFHQMVGFCTLAFGLVMAASLATYHRLDPSWNLATDNPVQNMIAFPGAVIADGLLQTFGVTSVFLIIACIGWGIRWMASIPLTWLSLRLFTLIGSILLSAAAIAHLPPPSIWPLPNHLGGAVGDILITHIYQIVSTTSFPLAYLGGITGMMAVLSVILLLSSLGFSFTQIFTGCAFIAYTFKVVVTALFRGCLALGSRIGGAVSSRLAEPADFPEDFSMSPDDPDLTRGFSPKNHGSLHVTSEDQEIFKGTSPRKDLRIEISTQEMDLTENEDDVANVRAGALGKTPIKSPNHYSSMPLGEEYMLPSLDLLDSSLRKVIHKVDPQLLEESAFQLKMVLEEFGVRGEIETVRPGPVVTMYELKPAAGIKTSRVIGLADDIARSMSALSTRIAVIPGRNVIGIELPNSTRETVYLRELLQSESYAKSTNSLALILGKDIGGHPVIADLAKMPHLLVAGTTGSGKSVAVNTMILSLLYRLPPDRCKFIMIDPKMLELSVYDDIPHLLSPVVTDPKKAVVALKWAVREMENRYRAMSKLGVRNIDGYNARIKEARGTGELLIRRVQTGFDPDSGKPIFENQPLDLGPLPYIVVVVDEMADLMLVAGKEIEGAVQRLAQMARAAGIHLIMATQRPSVDVITGTIKANFPTRISFQVTSKIDSRTILGEMGAEQLLGQGDMLFMAGGGRITRVHGPFVRDDEVERIVAFLKTQGEPAYVDSITEDEDELMGFDSGQGEGGDALYNQAVELVLREGKATTSFIQRHLKIGYNKAAGIIETMEKNGVVSEANHAGKREILR